MATVLAAAMLIAVQASSVDGPGADAAPTPMPDIPLKTVEVAEANGVDPVELLGAQVATHMDPDDYLCSVHEGPCPKPPPQQATSTYAIGVWDRLAGCETGGNWHSVSNPIYKGGLQFDAQTWAAYGGLAYAARADYATRDQQIAVAERLRAARGYQPWPACSRLLGLR